MSTMNIEYSTRGVKIEDCVVTNFHRKTVFDGDGSALYDEFTFRVESKPEAPPGPDVVVPAK